MKYKKLTTFIGGLVLSLALFGACRSGDKMNTITFNRLKVERSEALKDSTSSPRCKITIEVDECTDTSTAARKMNETIAEYAFGMKTRSVTAAADSFCRKCFANYKADLTELYRADQAHGVDAAWYDYAYSVTTSHEEGRYGLCYRIVKTRYEGGAHEVREVNCLNFNPSNGRRITLDDLMKPTYHAVLPPLLQEELLSKFDCRNLSELHDKGLLRLTDLYIPENYTLGDDGIEFLYNADEIAPYETGTVSLTLPYRKLEDLMKTEE